MKKAITAVGVALSLSMFCMSAAQAVPISAQYHVEANSSDPGLVIQTADLAPQPFVIDLKAGESFTFDLFSIWTDESAINKREDTALSPIEVLFDFTLPEALTTSIGGETHGSHALGGFFQYGKVSWYDPISIVFGEFGDGLMQVSLSDESFNFGVLGTLPGERFGDDVEATITMVSEATVPEPGTLGLMSLSLLGLAAATRRKKNA